MAKEGRSILVVDDEPKIVEVLSALFTSRGFRVFTAENGRRALEIFDGQNIDLVVLDLMMPGLSGEDVCRAIRRKSRVPVIMLTAKAEESDVVEGLGLGADDYVAKPFGLRELLARIGANLRREKRARNINSEDRHTRLYFGKLSLDLKGRVVRIGETVIGLTRREYEIVELLAMSSGQVFSREQIYEKIWGYDAEGDSSTVVEHVKKIRAKFSEVDPNTEYVSTVWGIGYKWNRDAR